jgi:hypothetical protein
MPNVIDTPAKGYAHCLNPRCPGYQQEVVPAIRRETQWTYTELDGDLPGIERSTVSYHFADEKDAACPTCKGIREVTAEPRATYQNLSGHDPNGLLKIRPHDSPDPASLQAEIAALKEKLGDAA